MSERARPRAPEANPWDEYASEYHELIAERERGDLALDPIVGRMLAVLGDLAGHDVLDACCGEGFFSRILAAHGARVTAIDLSPRLVEIARAREEARPGGARIDYRVGDLSRPLPELAARFDRIASFFGLNDVRDHEGFARTLHALARPGARLALFFNNPYSAVVRGHVADYFASGARCVYGGMSSRGVKVHYYHRRLDEYLDAFLGAGFRLALLVDMTWSTQHGLLPEGTRFPFGMLLAFDRPGRP